MCSDVQYHRVRMPGLHAIAASIPRPRETLGGRTFSMVFGWLAVFSDCFWAAGVEIRTARRSHKASYEVGGNAYGTMGAFVYTNDCGRAFLGRQRSGGKDRWAEPTLLQQRVA